MIPASAEVPRTEGSIKVVEDENLDVLPVDSNLQHLILPALANLNLIDFWDSGLLTMLEQSRCSLKRFKSETESSENRPTTDLQLFRQLLEASPDLEEVTLIVSRCMKPSRHVRELIPFFTCRPDLEVLPNLRLIDICFSDYREWPQEGILLTMVESRIARRKGLVVHLPYVVVILDDNVKQRVNDLQKRGCTLNLKYLGLGA